eukprot:CAMPEP_0202922978 /NCGR_PEP_ID=MMETSP1392-20130828/78210_1 /ASSEMBLY_ACC=CAM_ASM_000868 /TAXON_ID=225041 /ORGANISM="Chlamydomonas chlamydogama, Strain SAG 11-48b" /LENGTH=93 /DNA_ID=CAMNT_0049616635 /DNA_START=776 /DNA_END=1058 /DNA_ORIENTATION=+
MSDCNDGKPDPSSAVPLGVEEHSVELQIDGPTLLSAPLFINAVEDMQKLALTECCHHVLATTTSANLLQMTAALACWMMNNMIVVYAAHDHLA